MDKKELKANDITWIMIKWIYIDNKNYVIDLNYLDLIHRHDKNIRKIIERNRTTAPIRC